eukprot:TRINITY_DN81695_c0_g1_i1.p3 TRINITY_DN81695_c0_g1~~TRINITY_DN81695_c0_g1_i1.p3  ORF type:complete len:108 (-),score=20.72 TRINITY_DN81695_c0_g1_i1:612-935(-)
MELPKPVISVKQDVRKPLNEIGHHEEYQQLQPPVHRRNIDQGEFAQIPSQEILEGHFSDVGKGDEDDQFEDVEVEEHVEGIQPEILAENRLVLSPRKGDLQTPDHQR